MAANNRKRGAGTGEASDAEVEQFYAILGRVRDARRLQNSEVDRRPPAAPPAAAPAARAQPTPWRPTFSLEDFAPPRVAAGNGRPLQAPGIDLNAQPEPEPAAAPTRPADRAS